MTIPSIYPSAFKWFFVFPLFVFCRVVCASVFVFAFFVCFGRFVVAALFDVFVLVSLSLTFALFVLLRMSTCLFVSVFLLVCLRYCFLLSYLWKTVILTIERDINSFFFFSSFVCFLWLFFHCFLCFLLCLCWLICFCFRYVVFFF